MLNFSLSSVLSDCHNTGHKWDLLHVKCFKRNPPLLCTDKGQPSWREKCWLVRLENIRLSKHGKNHLQPRHLLNLSVLLSVIGLALLLSGRNFSYFFTASDNVLCVNLPSCCLHISVIILRFFIMLVVLL